MPSISKENAKSVPDFPGYREMRVHTLESDAPYLVSFEHYDSDRDWGEAYQGLGNGYCPSAHWGYVLKGKAGARYDDGTSEIFEAGEAFVVRPNHIPLTYRDSECVWFSTKPEFLMGLISRVQEQ